MLFATGTIEDVWFWATLWKICLVLGVGGFALMSIGVTIGGAADIKRLFARLIADHEREEREQRERESE